MFASVILLMKTHFLIFFCMRKRGTVGVVVCARSHLADESAELSWTEAVVDPSEDGDGDDDVAEETSEVVERVDAN